MKSEVESLNRKLEAIKRIFFMSWITDIILIFSLAEIIDDEDEDFEIKTPVPLININSWLDNNGKGTLENLSDHVSSGGKSMQTCVYGGGFSFLDIGKFKEIVKVQSWKDRKNVQLLIKEEQDEYLYIYASR
jgi:hypothetical protein